MKLLILGGTGEASALARALAGDSRFSPVLSLAGRTRHPAPQPLPTRQGGFGGAAGLARYLAAEGIDLLIDATHPFAVEISRNAVEAARATATPMLTVLRPEWEPAPGDHWLLVSDMPAAAAALGDAPRCVLLTIGRQDLAPFAAAPWHHYVVRSVDPPPPESLPPNAEIIAMRGPFLAADERRLLTEHAIEVLVTKNSGGSATVAKLHAARALGLPVVMVARPSKPASETRATVAEALAWLAARHAASLPRGA
jgi:precorrin-6A/cobalt-precorrin-6A reductase